MVVSSHEMPVAPLAPIAIGPTEPAILELPKCNSRIMVSSFLFSKIYPDTLKLMSNFLRRTQAFCDMSTKGRQPMFNWLLDQGVMGCLYCTTLPWDIEPYSSIVSTPCAYQSLKISRRGTLHLSRREILSPQDREMEEEAATHGRNQGSVPFCERLMPPLTSRLGLGGTTTSIKPPRGIAARDDQSQLQAGLKPKYFSTYEKWETRRQLVHVADIVPSMRDSDPYVSAPEKERFEENQHMRCRLHGEFRFAIKGMCSSITLIQCVYLSPV